MTRREAIVQGGRLLSGSVVLALPQGVLSACSASKPDPTTVAQIRKNVQKASLDGIRLTIVYDNYRFNEELQADWGFSCLVEGLDRTLLFDTGRYHDAFVSNLFKLGIDPKSIDELVLSHDHPDHVGGALKFLEFNSSVTVSLVRSFPSGFKKSMQESGADVAEIEQATTISRNVVSTGEMKDIVRNEHSLVLVTDQGGIVLTGCAHPGIVEIVERSVALTGQEILLVAGGFHLMSDYGSSIRNIALKLRDLGVRHVAPTHCSGGEARQIFSAVFGERFLNGGVGRVITAGDFI
ncbi:MAG: MBL fold metallo-hydrolase [Desulfobacteraceae bacterium]|nr:MBL fold metallo-hydrolase [Desulfobacteraceae bacterium]